MGYRGFLSGGEPAVEKEIDFLMTKRNEYGRVDAEFLAGYKMPMLVKIAAKIEHILDKVSPFGYSGYDLEQLRSTVLMERKKRIDAEFEWTDRYKARFLTINEKLLDACEKGWHEALEAAKILEERIKQGDSFVNDYSLDVYLTAWPRIKYDPEWVNAEYFGTKSLQHMNTQIGHGDNKYDYMLTGEDGFKTSIMIDKSLNWNKEEPFKGEFDDEYICYAMDYILGGYFKIWSIPDVLSITSISATAEIKHIFHEGIFKSNADCSRESRELLEQSKKRRRERWKRL